MTDGRQITGDGRRATDAQVGRPVRLRVRGALTLAALGALGPGLYWGAGIIGAGEALGAGLLLASVAVATARAIVEGG